MDLRTAFHRAGVVTMDGMLVRHVEHDGVINIGCSNEEGLEWSVDMLATQQIEVDGTGSACAFDLDGEPVNLTFYVPMAG